MKTSAIVCALLAGSFGLSGVASANQYLNGNFDRRHEQRGDQRSEQRGDQRSEPRGDRRGEQRAERHEQRRENWRNDRRDDGRRHEWRAGDRQPHYNHYSAPRYVHPQPHYSAPRYVYQPSYRTGPRFHRGSYLPWEYRQQPYFVSNWQAYPALYAPPYGYQWINVDGEFLLVALATGLIANALLY